MSTPVLSLITGTRNRPDSLKRLIKSVLDNTVVDFELIIGDASDEPVDAGNFPSTVRVIPERPRLGYSVGYNKAFAEATGEWALFLNDDCEVVKGYDTEAISFMRNHPQVGMGALHYSENDGPFHCNSSWGVLYCNFGILRRLLGNDIGWMDPEISFYGSDNAISFRVLLAGYGISDIPTARILHHSAKDEVRIENQRFRARDTDILYAKYMPLRQQWTATYNRHRVHTGTVPWAHGVSPEYVSR